MIRVRMQIFAHWSICMSPLWTILLLVTYVCAETFDFTKCDIIDNFRSEFVSASFKSLNAGQGCETNATTPLGQEVHIISVTPPDYNGDQWVVVKLSIHSRNQANLNEIEGMDFREDPGPIVFVLHSSVPVRWKVEMLGISSQEKHIFMLSKESSIHFQRKRTRMMVKSRKQVFPFSADSSAIFLWTQERFGAVTSYSVTSELSLKFYIGRDLNGSALCNLNNLYPSVRIFSYGEIIRPIAGCVSKRRNSHVRTKPVYIIELLEPPSPSPGMMGIDLELMPYNNGMNMRSKVHQNDDQADWNFYLVVKSPPGLTWTLHSKKISGWVDIVADAGADVKVTGVKISTVALRADDIKVTGRQLVEWSQDYIAPVHMYAGIHGANTIKLRVPPLEKNLASTRDRISTTDETEGDSISERGDAGDTNEQGKLHKYGNLDSLIKATCVRQMMEITISKKLFQMTGLDKNKVSLKDPSCLPAAETDGHIIFCTGFIQCGGTYSVDFDGMKTFTNAVVIQTSPGLVSSLLQDELGSGFFEEEEEAGSALNDFSMLVDDEDFRLNPVTISVECRLPATSQTNKIDGDFNNSLCWYQQPQSTAKCVMNIYSSLLFLRPRIEFPITVAKDSYLYIKAIIIDQDITLLVDACWFSTSSQPNDKNAETKEIITQGCCRDSSVNWMDEPLDVPHYTNLRYTKFRVRITDIFSGYSPVYLHCQFRTCQRGNNIYSQVCSIDGNVRCQQSAQASSTSIHHVRLPAPGCGPLTVGPLDLTDTEVHMKLPSGGSGTKIVISHEEQTYSSQQRVIIEGLDSTTVVGIAFAAFAIGILLTGALWFIHSHTGPVKRAVAIHREVETSGNMTPNSSSPMTT